MNFKKMLVIILIVVIAMFGMMLTTSYAWYSFTGAATTFDAVTSNKDIEVTFLKGEYINTTTAVPISSEDVDQYSDKHQFTVRTKNNPVGNEILAKISLVDITMNGSLQTSDFKIELYHQGNKFSTVTGNNMPTSGTKDLGNVYLDDDIDNQFEVRVYILDTGESQADLMNKTLSAKIQIDVVSRLKPNITSWDNPDIYVSGITIDGVEGTSLPTTGYYSMTSTCTKGSTLTWDGYTKTITYNNGSYVSDSCSLVFTSATSTKLLSEVEPGSYVEYIGTNGCDGKHCEGQNANYVSDNKMGYCGLNYQFTVNGWRVAYVTDGSAYLVSAGAPECLSTYLESVSESISSKDLSSDYYYGSGYTFDTNTGKYSLTGTTASALAWSTNYETILKDTPYTCMYDTSTATCSNMYKIVEYSSDTAGMAYTYYFYDMEHGAPTHLSRLNSAALEYCNSEFAYGGVCDSSSAWAMNASDFKIITGKNLSSDSCYRSYSDKNCGYLNSLIDNGGYYWFSTIVPILDSVTSVSYRVFIWSPDERIIGHNASEYSRGIRPILKLKPSIFIAGGSGTYEDPYTIYNDPNYVYVPEEDEEEEIIIETTEEVELCDTTVVDGNC